MGGSIREKEMEQRQIEEKMKQKQPENMKLADRLRRYKANKIQSENEEARRRKEKEVLEKENGILEEELNRMKTSLEALEEATPQTQSGVRNGIEMECRLYCQKVSESAITN